MIDVISILKESLNDAYNEIDEKISKENDIKNKKVIYQEYKSFLLNFANNLKKQNTSRKDEMISIIKQELKRLHESKEKWGLK